ncbi:carbohydrate ABC transporter permease [Streptantibioticus silvisoli]|jgi:multiple sugar transport system permease protein|uniref:Carbohydrate ABC transporter permease n=1 Tax=Streptantibioticus silvisoli TaxID=2705255 RepID=A0ABT6WA66_9ACTN|nr:carbohydrate ABC transporter permease [Streptantibioticus silvisoli]MDI5966768.1 carbohydrate ABC transporter permease [Streptantibioticus silvisoli]
MTAPGTLPAAAPARRSRKADRARGDSPAPARIALHIFLAGTCLVWLVPLLYAFYTALRPYADTARRGYVSVGGHYGTGNFSAAWVQAQLPHYFWNSVLITVPALVLTLWLASMVAFVVARFRFRINIALLMLFTAGNLLPQQAIVTPLFKLYQLVPLPQWLAASGKLDDSFPGLILIHVAFQTGFCAFVMSNYMRTIPAELGEAAVMDGASVWRQYWQVILPLCRPVLAALATLEFTWIYNDFFWATVLMQTGANRPVTAALNNLTGEFFVNNNLIAAAALIVAIPTLVVFFALQRQFVSGLTLGANKG